MARWKLTVAGVPMDPILGDKGRNLGRCLQLIQDTARATKARLIVFPECALTGYMFSSLEEACEYEVFETVCAPRCEPVSGTSTKKIIEVCQDLNVYVAIGLLEKDDDKYFNTAVLLGPEEKGLIGKHRKLHRPFLGIDRFLSDGNLPPTVFRTKVGRIGMGICYDMMFPEYSRVLALKKADVLIFPSNWPEAGRVYTDYIVPARAIENHVFCVAVNRVGEERGTTFIGGSLIAHFDLHKGLTSIKGENEHATIHAEINLTEAGEKHAAIVPDEHEVDLIKDRKPQFYREVCQKMAVPEYRTE